MNRKVKNTFLLFWAIAVLGICVSSLVNFHQHKIWGKPLLPQLLYTKRDKEKSIDLLKAVNPDLSNGSNNQLSVDFAFVCDCPSIALLVVTDNHYPIQGPPGYSRYLLFSGTLRAPPVA